MSLDLQKIRERVEEAIDQWSRTLLLSHAEPSGLFSLLDSLHCLNVLEREERDRFPIVYAEVPDRAAELELIEAAIAYRDIAMVSDRDIQGAGGHTVRFADAVRAYRKAVNQ